MFSLGRRLENPKHSHCWFECLFLFLYWCDLHVQIKIIFLEFSKNIFLLFCYFFAIFRLKILHWSIDFPSFVHLFHIFKILLFIRILSFQDWFFSTYLTLFNSRFPIHQSPKGIGISFNFLQISSGLEIHNLDGLTFSHPVQALSLWKTKFLDKKEQTSLCFSLSRENLETPKQRKQASLSLQIRDSSSCFIFCVFFQFDNGEFIRFYWNPGTLVNVDLFSGIKWRIGICLVENWLG